MKSQETISSIWLISEKILTLAINLVVMLWIARALGPESYGKLNYLLAITALLAPITALGLNSIITKEVLTRAADTDVILGSSILIRVLGGCLALLGIGILAFTSNIAQGANTQLIILAVANVFTAFYVVDFYMQANMFNKSVVKLKLIIMLLLNGARIISLFYQAPLEIYLYICAVEMLFTGVGFLVLYQIKTQNFSQLRAHVTEAKTLVSKSIWLLLSGVAAIIYLKVDQLMLGLLSSQTEVGIYSVASRLSEVWYFLPTALVISHFPKLIKLKDSEHYQLSLQKLNDLLFVLAICIAIPTALVAKPVIILLFGEAYQASGTVLTIHIWAGVFIFMRALLSKWLINENLLRFSLLSQLSGAIINIALNFWLIPLYGAIGAAVATVVSYAVASYFILYLHSSTRVMASIMSKSFILPIRLLILGKTLYKCQQ